MGMLTLDEVQSMALAHRKVFEAVCDDCEHLIPVGALYVVLKYHKLQRWTGPVNQKPYTWARRIPKKVRCLDCEKRIHADVYEKYAKKKKAKLGKKGKKLTPEEVDKIHPVVKKAAILILKKSGEPIIATVAFKTKLFSRMKKKEPKMKRSVINASLRYLRKAKVIICKQKLWSLP